MSQTKTIAKFVVAQIIVVLFFTVIAAGQSLEGEKAVAELKKNGQYDSLMDAMRAARGDKDDAEPQSDDAIGQSAKLVASDGAANDNFGISVAISGDTAIVGVYLDDVGANTNQGSAYVFTRTGTVWTQQQQLTAADGAATDQFGIGVAISGNNIIVGANGDNVGANVNQGSAYVFTRTGTVWTQRQQLMAVGGLANDEFGFSVAISGDKIIVGAPFSDASVSTPLHSAGGSADFSPQATDQGAVFLFVNTPLAPTAAGATVAGRVLTASGSGIRNVVIRLTDSTGQSRTTRTGSFGYYSFEDVTVGQTYVVSLAAKRFTFANPTQVITVNDNIGDLDFTALE